MVEDLKKRGVSLYLLDLGGDPHDERDDAPESGRWPPGRLAPGPTVPERGFEHPGAQHSSQAIDVANRH
jgi:hypothetical protein